MRFKAELLGIESGGPHIVTLSKDDAYELGVRSGERVKLQFNKKEVYAIVNVVTKSVQKGILGIYDEMMKIEKINEGEYIDVEVAEFPESLHFLQNKLKKRKLNSIEILEIVKDVVRGNLSDTEISAFITALEINGLDVEETTSLTMAMVETGKTLNIGKRPICDKHSIGGVPGDKSTLLIVPIIASAGLTIPKTSSRAITSASGTADRAEVLMPVDLEINEMKYVVEKTNGCIVWGGALELAPADDRFIQIEYPLSIDPLLLPSIMAKKKAVGANYLALDIPTGRGAKVKTIGDAELLAKDFMELGRKLGIKTHSVITFGEQPIGHAIGPALEAKEAWSVLQGDSKIFDLVDKSIHICSLIFGMAGIGGAGLALDILKRGKAEKKMREIIYHQGGNSEIKIDDIKVGTHFLELKSETDGHIMWLNNQILVEISRAAGAPRYKGSGILVHKKLGEKVKKNETILTIVSEKTTQGHNVEKILNEVKPFFIGTSQEIIIHTILDVPQTKKTFIFER